MAAAPVDTRVSVALCTYNGAAYLGEQLDSIAGQSVLPGEIVISDDGSTDDTLAIAERFAEDSVVPVRILRNTTALGVTKNFEGAIGATTGVLIVLADQDDVWRDDRVERALEAFDARPEVQLVSANARLVGADGAPLGSTLFASLSIGPSERDRVRAGDAFDVLLRRNLVTGATVMLRREVFDAARPFPSPWVHDEWLAIVAASRGPILMLDEPLVDYRQHGANQIGIAEPTLTYKVSRLLQPGRQRNRDIADRVAGLGSWLRDARGAAPLADASAVAAKAAFERFRADLPPARWRRVLPVLRRAPRGEYQRYASQGALDIVRDLVQPA